MSSRYRIYVGGLSTRTSPRSLKILFSRYGHLLDIDLKSAYAFIEFEDYRDAADAIKDMCYNCGERGHWASECQEEDGRGRCYRCGRKGHERKDCRERSRTRTSREDNGGDREHMTEEYGGE